MIEKHLIHMQRSKKSRKHYKSYESGPASWASCPALTLLSSHPGVVQFLLIKSPSIQVGDSLLNYVFFHSWLQVMRHMIFIQKQITEISFRNKLRVSVGALWPVVRVRRRPGTKGSQLRLLGLVHWQESWPLSTPSGQDVSLSEEDVPSWSPFVAGRGTPSRARNWALV